MLVISNEVRDLSLLPFSKEHTTVAKALIERARHALPLQPRAVDFLGARNPGFQSDGQVACRWPPAALCAMLFALCAMPFALCVPGASL